jgi:hypothetical protein
MTAVLKLNVPVRYSSKKARLPSKVSVGSPSSRPRLSLGAATSFHYSYGNEAPLCSAMQLSYYPLLLASARIHPPSTILGPHIKNPPRQTDPMMSVRALLHTALAETSVALPYSGLSFSKFGPELNNIHPPTELFQSANSIEHSLPPALVPCILVMECLAV